MTATPMQVRQWSEAVARDPGDLAFLPLAEAYREQGRRDAALRLCIRGLERHPENVEAHYLLGVLYREGGEQVKAFDEWDIALRLAPDHAAARRAIGLLCVDRADWSGAIRHLERAVADAPDDGELRSALDLARTNAAVVAPMARPGPAPAASAASAPPAQAAAPSAEATPSPAPSPATAEASSTAAPWVPTPTQVPATATPPTVGAAATQPAAGSGQAPVRWESMQDEFAALGSERGVVGAVVLDEHGYVIAGEMHVGGRDRAPEVAAVLAGSQSEAERAVRHLGLGTWRGILLETPEATVRLAPVADGMLAVAARREVPTGWVLRFANRAREAALRWMGAGGGA